MAEIHGPKIITSGLFLHLDSGNPQSFDGNSTTWRDLSGQNNNGTISGATYTGSNGGVMIFDGVNDYVNLGDVLDISGGLTWSCWFKCTNVSTIRTLMSKDSGSGNRGPFLYLQQTTGQLVFAISINGITQTSVSTSDGYLDGNWHCVNAIFTPSTSIEIIVDGVSDAINVTSIPSTQFNSSANLWIGSRPSNSMFFNGSLNEPLIYNRALTFNDCTQNFNAQRSRFGI